MINTFKNFERLRYRLSTDFRNITSENKDNSTDSVMQITNTFFSTVFTAVITIVTLPKIDITLPKTCTWLWGILLGILLLALYVGIYIAVFFAYSRYFDKVMKALSLRKKHKLPHSVNEMELIQKDFDNIACDSILVAQEYAKNFTNLSKSKDENSAVQHMKVFYYYEIMHYLDTASKKTIVLITHWEKCVRTREDALGVDIYRIKNILNIMYDLDEFLDSNFEHIKKGNEYKKEVIKQHNQIKRMISNINKALKSHREGV